MASARRDRFVKIFLQLRLIRARPAGFDDRKVVGPAKSPQARVALRSSSRVVLLLGKLAHARHGAGVGEVKVTAHAQWALARRALGEDHAVTRELAQYFGWAADLASKYS